MTSRPPPVPSPEDRTSAVHESAHACAAYLTGLFRGTDAYVTRHATGLDGAAIQEGDPHTLVARALVRLAGQRADAETRGDPAAYMNSEEYRCSEDFLRVESSLGHRAPLIKNVEEVAERLVRTHWEQIVAVAAALCGPGVEELNVSDLERIVGSVESSEWTKEIERLADQLGCL